MTNKEIIAVDVDDVTLDLVGTWLQKYNKDYKDNLTKNQILEWNVQKFVKPECGAKIFDYIENPKIYGDMPPLKGAIEGVRFLKMLEYRNLFL